MGQIFATPPPEGHAQQGPMLDHHTQPDDAPQLHQIEEQATLSGNPMQPHTIAAPIAPNTGLSPSAMQGPHAHAHKLAVDGVQMQPLPAYPPPAGPSTPARSHLHPTRAMQPPQEAHAAQTLLPPAIAQDWPNTIDYGQTELVTAGLTDAGQTTLSSAATDMHIPHRGSTDSSNRVLEGASASMPPKKGFGGILSGVVKEAAETATKRPPVFRYEDFKTVSCPFMPIECSGTMTSNSLKTLVLASYVQARCAWHKKLKTARQENSHMREKWGIDAC